MESPLEDLPYRRLSAMNLFNVKYALHSSAMLRSILVSHGVKAPK